MTDDACGMEALAYYKMLKKFAKAKSNGSRKKVEFLDGRLVWDGG